MSNKKWFQAANRRLLPFLAALVALVSGLLAIPALQTTAQDLVLPSEPPDAAAGLEIYAERCVVCHGEMGDGQGSQAVQAGLEPAAFSNPDYRLTAVPSLMYDIISNGNLAAGMPPFGEASGNPLSEADIWNMIALAYSFSTRPEDIEAGEALAAELEADTVNWPGLEYWFSRSNETILADMALSLIHI